LEFGILDFRPVLFIIGFLLSKNPLPNIYIQLHFLGIHIISPEILHKLPDKKVFSIIDAYLALAKQKTAIQAYEINTGYWFDLGRHDSIVAAEAYLKHLH